MTLRNAPAALPLRAPSGSPGRGPDEHEVVHIVRDRASGYLGIIAIHDTTLGPALGGTRFRAYRSRRAAVADARRLSRGMTHKAALANLPFGGGKAVIVDTGTTQDRAALFRRHGRAIEELGGRFITAEDVGTTPEDMAHVRACTSHVVGLPDTSGDPGPWTARGVVRAMQAAAAFRWGSADLHGRVVAIQGCGSVGARLASQLSGLGASLIVTDTDPAAAARVIEQTGALAVGPEAILHAEADVFAPCALGGVLDDRTIPRLRVAMVIGGANDQLARPRHAELLAARGILLVPDYAANAGGLIIGSSERLGLPLAAAAARVDAIHDTVSELLHRAEAEGVTPYQAAERMVHARLAATAT